MQHCIYYECNMCGSNSRAESDRRPVYLCPICTAKITWATDSDPEKRAEKLLAFCQQHGLDDAAAYYAKAVKVLADTKNRRRSKRQSSASDKLQTEQTVAREGATQDPDNDLEIEIKEHLKDYRQLGRIDDQTRWLPNMSMVGD